MARLTVVCVLRSGGEYGPEHVAWLQRQVEARCSKRLVCFSDVDVPCKRIPLQHNWRGWWSKLEVMSPSIKGDVLFLDLDTVVVGDLEPLLALGKTTALRDVNDLPAEVNLQSSIMYLTEADRRRIWDKWIVSPRAHMDESGSRGDQYFIGRALGEWQQFQKVLPGALISYKVGMVSRNLTSPPAGTAAVVFHGKPRPWQVEAEWIPNLT